MLGHIGIKDAFFLKKGIKDDNYVSKIVSIYLTDFWRLIFLINTYHLWNLIMCPWHTC